jgi:soluble lytic murein transglycosylase
VALGRALDALGKARYGEALTALDAAGTAAPDPTLLADYRAWLKARALQANGQPAEARAALAAIGRDPPGAVPCKPNCRHPLYPDARELAAKTWEASQPKKAAAILAELPADGRLLAHAAELSRSAGDDKGAEALEARLLSEAADAPEAKALATQLGSKTIGDRLGFDRWRNRIFRLLDAHDNEVARSEAEALAAELPKKHPLLCELLYVQGKASRKLREYGKAVDSLSQARKECAARAKDKPPKGRPKAAATSSAALEAWALRASLLETEVRAIRGDVEGARKVALFIADGHPKHSFADDALFFLAETLEQRGQAEEARGVYQRIVDVYGAGDLAPEAAWRLAFDAIKSSDAERAKSWLGRIANGPAGDTIEGSRARYWRARLEEPNPKRACQAYREAMLAPALTFYAWLALDRLERTDPACAKERKTELLELAGTATVALAATASTASTASVRPQAVAIELEPRTLARAARLAQIPGGGFKVYASLELGLLQHPAMPEQEVVALALAYDGIGDHREAQLLLRTRAQVALSAFPSGPTQRVWRAAYSRPFLDELEGAAREQKLDPWLLYALAREESTFDPAVISWAGAVGLAQLMPATALGASAALKIRGFDVGKLTDPAINLRLGAYVLHDGLRYFSSSVPLALAAYNGGIGLADKHLPPSEQDFDLWVESLPVKETRKYVKRVIQTYAIYRFLYEPSAPFIDLPDTIRPRGVRQR